MEFFGEINHSYKTSLHPEDEGSMAHRNFGNLPHAKFQALTALNKQFVYFLLLFRVVRQLSSNV
jgi:hypothetical protein